MMVLHRGGVHPGFATEPVNEKAKRRAHCSQRQECDSRGRKGVGLVQEPQILQKTTKHDTSSLFAYVCRGAGHACRRFYNHSYRSCDMNVGGICLRISI